MVDLYWKCYAYGDELKPHIEFLDGIMLSSTRDIAPSCVENVDELIERQEKSLVQLETKRAGVIPKRRLRLDSLFSTTPNQLGKAMQKAAPSLLMSLTNASQKLTRSRNISTLSLLLKTWQRDKQSSTKQELPFKEPSTS